MGVGLVGRESYGRFPKFHRVFLGRDPGTLKSDIVSKELSTINLVGFDSQIENSKIEIMETDRTIGGHRETLGWSLGGFLSSGGDYASCRTYKHVG